MKVRGNRECAACGERWSYFETGSVACPDCGSVRSVGVDERTRHTDAPVEYDLTPARNRVDEDSLSSVADDAADRSAEYCRKRGFVDAGELRRLDDVYLAATTVRHVGSELARGLRPSEDEELFFLELLGGADDGERPPSDAVPDAFRSAWGLAAADAVRDYRRDVRTFLEDHPDESARTLSGRIGDHRKRIAALDGDVPPRDADRLVGAARDLGKYLRTDESSALVTADNWLGGIE